MLARHHSVTWSQLNMEDGPEIGITPTCPISPLTATASCTPTRRRKVSGSAGFTMSRRPPSSRLKQVSIGPQLDRWDTMKSRLGVDSHAQLAEMLLDGMEAIVGGDVVWGTQCSDPTLKNKLASFFKRKGIPALVIPRSLRSTSRTSSDKKTPVKLKITLKKEVRGRRDPDVNGHEDIDEGENEGEEDGESDEGDDITMEDNIKDQDYSPHEPSCHGLKKAWLGRHLKGNRKSQRQRKGSLAKTTTDKDEAGAGCEAVDVKKKDRREEWTDRRRKLRRNTTRKKLVMKKLKAKKVEKAPAKSFEELFGLDAVQVKVYCCRKCKMQLDSLDVMKAHWQAHVCEEEGGNDAATTVKNEDGGSESKVDGRGIVEDVKKISRVMTRCPLCQKAFSNILAHTSCNSNFLCEECGMMFRQRRSLKLHRQAVHELENTGQLPFLCTRCGRAFRWEASLRKHRTLHSQHRQFICQTCGKSFKVQAHLKRHEIMHEEVKPFVCPHCGRRFTELSNMKVHTRIHTGEKPYICDVCKRAYAHKVSLKTHKKKEHGIDMWQLGYLTQPVIEFDDEGKETEYSIARRSRRPSFDTSGKARKKKTVPKAEPQTPGDAMTSDQGASFVEEKNQSRTEVNDRGKEEESETMQTSQVSTPAPAPLQHFIESKPQVPLQQNVFQQQQQQLAPRPPPPLPQPPLQQLTQIQPPIQQPPPPPHQDVHPSQHLHPHHLHLHNQSYPHGHPGESSHQHIEDDMDSEPCSPDEEEEETPRLLQAELMNSQLRHSQRMQIQDSTNHPSQPMPLQLPQSQPLQIGQQQPSHTQTQTLPSIQIPGMRQLPPQSLQTSQRPPLPSFESVTSPDRQSHHQYRQGMMNTMSGLDLNALVASSIPYMYWGSQQYQGIPPYIQRNTEDNSMETQKQ